MTTIIKLIISGALLSVPSAWANLKSPRILLMDSMEFAYVQNHAGKKLYVKKIGQILRSMNLKTKKYDMAAITDSQLTLLIQDQNAWSDIEDEVQARCRKKIFRHRCDSLAKIRLKTFEFIKNHPE